MKSLKCRIFDQGWNAAQRIISNLNVGVISWLLVIGIGVCPSLYAEIRGKVDVGYADIMIHLHDANLPKKRIPMQGFSLNSTLVVWKGLCLKPHIISGSGREGHLLNLSLGAGCYIPFGSFCVLPSVGITRGYLRGFIDLPQVGLENIKQRFKTWTPYVGVDVSYTISEKWSVCMMVQYGWATTHFTISRIISQKTHTSGFNLVGQIDYYFTSNWSANFAIAKNESWEDAKVGIVGYGGRLGLGYCF